MRPYRGIFSQTAGWKVQQQIESSMKPYINSHPQFAHAFKVSCLGTGTHLCLCLKITVWWEVALVTGRFSSQRLKRTTMLSERQKQFATWKNRPIPNEMKYMATLL